MVKQIKIILIVIIGAILILMGLIYLYLYWVILPVNSSSHTLTLVKYGYPNPKRITLRHYVDGEHINDYVLELKEGLRYQMPQSYGLPELKKGMVEVVVELENRVDGSDGSIKVNYEKANNLYKMGLLLYFDTDYNQYVHFVSGNERIVYFEKDDSPDWSLIMDTPPPKRFTPAGMEYAPLFDSNWKEENNWYILPVK